jgi:hypothetical protein
MTTTRHWYIHRPLDQTVEAIGGSYELTREARAALPLGGERVELLYLVGYARVDRSCCGVGGCGFAHVQGRVLDWKVQTTFDGYAMTLVAPIAALEERAQVAAFLGDLERVSQVGFRDGF